MKVLMINTEKDRGGAARMATTLVNAINRQELDVQAILAHCGDNDVNESFRGYKKSYAFYLNIFQTRLLGSHRIYDFGFADEAIKLAKDADVIHLHNLHGYYLDFVKLINGIGNKPVVWTWHDMWGATGRCGFSMDCMKWEDGCSRCGHLDYYPKVWLDNAASEYHKKTELFLSLNKLHIVSPSEWLRQIAISRGFNQEFTHTIPNPVDLSKYQPVNQIDARLKLNLPNRNIALFVAHDCNDERKRYHDFEQVIRISKVQGVVVGVPPVNKDPNIIYLGKLTDSDQLKLAYSSADAFVITSKSDNYPNTVVESMACGTPVFGYAVGGIPSQMQDNWNGLVQFGDYESLSEKISKFLSEYENKYELRSNISSYARTNWDSSIIANKYVQLYKKILV